MNERKLLEIQWCEFYFLLDEYKGLGVSESDMILNIGMFLGKFAFDTAPNFKEATKLLNKGIDAGKRWSMEEAEESEDVPDG